MRFIDEKGRLFGKINVIDFLVILFLFCLSPMFYFGYRLFKKPIKPDVVSVTQNLTIEINCNFTRVKPEILKLITVGDKEKDGSDAIIGEIIEVGESKPYQYKIDIGGEILIQEDPVLKEIPIRLKVKTEIRNNELYYKDRKIKLNAPIEFKTTKYTLEALSVKKEIKEAKIISAITKIDLNVTLKGLNDATLKLISLGDRELDKNGEIIAEILSIGKKENDIYEINLGSGTFVRGDDSVKKQLSVKMRLKCQLSDDYQLYFKGNRVINNSWLEFNTDKYSAKGKIAMTYESPPILLKNRWVQLVVKFTGVIPEVAKIIQEGDIEKDPESKIAAKLKTIISNKSSDILVLKEDKWITVIHPFQKDVVVILEMSCIEKDGILYFKNYPVKMGNAVTFTTDIYSISGVITGIEYL